MFVVIRKLIVAGIIVVAMFAENTGEKDIIPIVELVAIRNCMNIDIAVTHAVDMGRIMENVSITIKSGVPDTV